MTFVTNDFDEAAWDARLAELGGHFLQSVVWGLFQQNMGQTLRRGSSDTWQWQAGVAEGRGSRYLYAPYGPTIKHDPAAAVGSLIEAGRQSRADFVRLEPIGNVDARELMALEALRVAEMQPQHTRVLDLTQVEADLRSALSSGHRNAINGAQRRGLSITSSTDPNDGAIFLRLLKLATARAGIRPHPDRYYDVMLRTLMPRGAARLYLASHLGNVVVAAICFDWNNTRYYAHAASDPVAARQLQAAAPIVWQMILDAKSQGSSVFDLFGIAPTDDPKHPWAGFTKFKAAFGGAAVVRAGTWEVPLKSLKHLFYRTAKKVLG